MLLLSRLTGRAGSTPGTAGFLRGAAVCRCGHEKAAHEHYRAGSDCAGCACGRFHASRHAVAMPIERPRRVIDLAG